MIEDFIHKNIGAFFNEDLADGHIERFEQRLKKDLSISKNNWSLKNIMLAASIIFLISAITIILLNMKYTLPDKQIFTSTAPEMYEAEKFYMDAISEKINILNKKQKISSDLSADLKEIDKTIKNISKDIAQNPGDERLLSAVINVYQSKLDLLDDIITHTR
jgi:translation elongation factor EF-G